MRDDVSGPRYVKVAQSAALDAGQAVRDVMAGMNTKDICFVLVFVPPRLQLDELSAALEVALCGVPAFGCTTAGQLTPSQYGSDNLLLIAFPKEHFRCASVLFEPLRPISIPTIAASAERHAARFPHTAGWSRLALLFADGMSNQEDMLASTLDTVLGGLPIFGGSAGDGLSFGETFVLHKGKFHANAAVLLMLETNLQFQGVNFDHFLPTGSQLVITKADPEERIVYEINGAPAAQEYARLVGCAEDELSPDVFAANPMLVQHKMNYYVRAVFDVTDDGALSFLAAIDDGLIMTMGRGQEVVETLQAGLRVKDQRGGAPDFILGFDCVLRKLEIEQKQLSGRVSELFAGQNVVGFNTYGEQHRGVHMNQTFVGVAFFDPVKRSFS